ncbi:hypothetical protein MKZ38_004393 [Zalerion maritima]|uniref:Uncharacterized protein n=1 Tax=Zalerion maritima TaxID=339359 RepID=A0AAD5WPX5_9PEZI|nr:hypothetical protein MKZ38_004393 [Zalerion maritima]
MRIASSIVETDVTRHPRPSCSPEQRLQRRAVEPRPTPSHLAEEKEDDVISLGTFPRQPYHNTAVSAFRCPAIDSNRPLDISPQRNTRKKKKKAGRSVPREQTDARTTQCKGATPSRQPTIPSAIRNQNVWLGRARDLNGQVYGFFDRAGRFCRRVKVKRSGKATEHWSSFAPIPHDQVVYRPLFQHITYPQVRAERTWFRKDVRVANMLLNSETNEVIIIDFERAPLLRPHRRPLAQLVPNKRAWKQETMDFKTVTGDSCNRGRSSRGFPEDILMAKTAFLDGKIHRKL